MGADLEDLPLFAPIRTREADRALARLQRSRVAAWLERRGHIGGTQDAAAQALSIPRQTLCFRFRELEGAGLAIKTDRKLPTLFGRLATVYLHREFADG